MINVNYVNSSEFYERYVFWKSDDMLEIYKQNFKTTNKKGYNQNR